MSQTALKIQLEQAEKEIVALRRALLWVAGALPQPAIAGLLELVANGGIRENPEDGYYGGVLALHEAAAILCDEAQEFAQLDAAVAALRAAMIVDEDRLPDQLFHILKDRTH